MKKRRGGHLNSKKDRKSNGKILHSPFVGFPRLSSFTELFYYVPITIVFYNASYLENPGVVAFEDEFGSISDYGQEAWNKLSPEVVNELSKTVVSVASFIGNEMYFGCTVSVLRSNEAGASILTSAGLVKADDGRNMKSVLSVQVRLPNNEVSGGCVAHYDLHYNIAVIIIPPFPGFRTASFDVPKEFEPHSKVVAVGCWFSSGKFIATTGILNAEPIGVYPEHLRTSTCKIPMVMTGGPLVDSDGYFVGKMY